MVTLAKGVCTPTNPGEIQAMLESVAIVAYEQGYADGKAGKPMAKIVESVDGETTS